MKYNLNDLHMQLKFCLSFLKEYKYLTEAYIIEYFTENHWRKLPKSWQRVLNDLSPPDVATELLTPGTTIHKEVWPLSLIAFKETARLLSLPRTATSSKEDFKDNPFQHKVLKHIFRKHVSPKKQHEIHILAKIIARTFSQGKCTSVIDTGSGQGHLSRLLSLGHHLPVISLEQEATFIQAAEKYDDEAKTQILKTKTTNTGETSKLDTPHHMQYTVLPDVSSQEFINDLVKGESQRYLLTGLHACGDLSATMVRLFKESTNISALVSVACCYMKLTTGFNEPVKTSIKPQSCDNGRCYPMSNYVKKLDDHELPYKSREVSCHAIEDYIERLKENGPHLKMHCYRATLESLIRKKHPSVIRPGVQTIKKAYLLPFAEYVEKSFEKLKLSPPEVKPDDPEITFMLGEWSKVVVFFSLALLVAPVIETVILLDRMLYLMEHDLHCELQSVFEPILSPRCFAIIATKKESGIV